jgi:hypothetical protein
MTNDTFWAARERCPVAEGELRLLSAWEILMLREESAQLAQDGPERALCSNACLIARVLERDDAPVYPDGQAVLQAMSPEEIGRLADRWGDFNRTCNPSPTEGEREIGACRRSLEQSSYARLQWRVLRAFGALPTEERVQAMTDRDYLWCALNLALDREEELDRLWPDCRRRAEAEACPVCGAETGHWEHNRGFDLARFEQRKGENAGD